MTLCAVPRRNSRADVDADETSTCARGDPFVVRNARATLLLSEPAGEWAHLISCRDIIQLFEQSTVVSRDLPYCTCIALRQGCELRVCVRVPLTARRPPLRGSRSRFRVRNKKRTSRRVGRRRGARAIRLWIDMQMYGPVYVYVVYYISFTYLRSTEC